MSIQYDQYIAKHKQNVKKGLDWFRENLPELVHNTPDVDFEWQIGSAHDSSKLKPDEYEAYDAYFYGGNKSFAVVQEFKKAWLTHIHRNPHHWQHWILVQDDPNEPTVIFQMPYNYVIEMICDWWAFSWVSGNLRDIFKWYDEHKEHMQLNPATCSMVESILGKIKEKLEEGRGGE